MQHLDSNWDFLSRGISRFSKIKVHKPDATYLVWADFRETNLTDDQLNKLLVHEAGLGFSPGTEYGQQGLGFQRINIACPVQTIELALKRLDKIAKYLE
jgi:cystathionine beta-lyase